MKAYCSFDVTNDPVEVIDEFGDVDFVDGEDYVLIQKIYVPEAQRGKGLARKMLTSAVAEARSELKGLDIKLWCEALEKSVCTERLQAFYESAGFEATGVGAEMIFVGV